MNYLEMGCRLRELEKQIEIARKEMEHLLVLSGGDIIGKQENYKKSLELDELIEEYVDLKEAFTSRPLR